MGSVTQSEMDMNPNLARTLISAAALCSALAATLASGNAGATTVTKPIAPTVATQRAMQRDVFTDGARTAVVDPYTDGASRIAGRDRTGVSADPARSLDPYLDGGARLAGMDTSGVSGTPGRQFNVFQDGAVA
jgi:hypothetical protein